MSTSFRRVLSSILVVTMLLCNVVVPIGAAVGDGLEMANTEMNVDCAKLAAILEQWYAVDEAQ